MPIYWTVGPYDKQIVVKCEYTDFHKDIRLERVWLDRYDISGYFDEAQWSQLRDELETKLLEN